MATESYSASLAEWARVIRHLCNMKRLRAEAQRLHQRPETLDALDSVIAVDTARVEELNVRMEAGRVGAEAASGSGARHQAQRATGP